METLPVDSKMLLSLVNYLSAPSSNGGGDGGDGGPEVDVSEFLDNICEGVRTKGDPLVKSKSHVVLAVSSLLMMLRETLLTQRWSEVLKVLIALTHEMQGVRDSPIPLAESLWQGSCAVFQNDPEARKHPNHLEKIVGQFRQFSEVKNKEVCLEFVFLLMSQGRFQEAHHSLKNIPRIALVKPTERIERASNLVAAYDGLVWYMEWLEEKQKLDSLHTQTTQDCSQLLDFSSMGAQEQVMKADAEKACASFDKLRGVRGVWDVFITKHVQLLEFYSKHDEVLQVLQSYCETNPDNPNSHIFLFEKLRETGAEDSLQIETLQTLRKLSPSNLLMVELHKLLHKSGATTELFNIIFDLLDYPVNNDSIDAWKTLLEDLRMLGSSKDGHLLKAFSETWTDRNTWWPLYHFKIPPPDGSSVELLTCKAAAAYCLTGNDNMFSSHVRTLPMNEEQMKILDQFQSMCVIFKSAQQPCGLKREKQTHGRKSGKRPHKTEKRPHGHKSHKSEKQPHGLETEKRPHELETEKRPHELETEKRPHGLETEKRRYGLRKYGAPVE